MVAPRAALFIEAGLRLDFVDALNAAADELLRTKEERGSQRSAVKGSTKAIAAMIAEGRLTVRVLDAMVQSASGRDANLQGRWESVKRVHHVARTRRLAAPPKNELPALPAGLMHLLLPAGSATPLPVQEAHAIESTLPDT